MKNFYLAASETEDGKNYAHVIKVPDCSNLCSILAGYPNTNITHICATKKRAAELVNFWNECYKENGTYMFSVPLF